MKNATTTLFHLSLLLFTFAAPASTVPASAYVQSGLIAQWDGIDNAGTGTHDANATEWVDLKQGIKLQLLDNDYFGEDYLFVTNVTHIADKETFSGFSEVTLEAYSVPTWNDTIGNWNCPMVSIPYVGSIGYDARTGGCSVHYFTSSGQTTVSYQSFNSGYDKINNIVAAAKWQTYSARIGINSRAVSVNGETRATTTGLNWTGGTRSNSTILNVGNTKARMKMSSIRVYNRKLTDDEIVHNALIDEIRFEDLDGYRWNSTTEKLECRIAVSAAGEGTVTVDGGAPTSCGAAWTEYGASVTLTPTAASGWTFYGWSGDTDDLTVGEGGVATLAAADARELTCRFRPADESGVERVWTGAAGDGQWFTAGNWSPEGVPAAGDEVLIESGTVSLTNATAALLACRLSGASAKMLFAEPVRCAPDELVTALNARYVTLENGASMSHVTNLQTYAEFTAMATPTWLMDGRVSINCQTFVLDATSKIDVGGRGYFAKGTKACAPGPGGANGVASDTGVAPSYGGWSGYQGRFVAAGATKWKSMPYGTPEAPVYPGTAGGFGNSNTDNGSPGGGAVRIVASGRVTLEGAIKANGGFEGSDVTVGSSRKAGTGGAVWITCAVIAGGGTITANSGAVDLSGNLIGSGGRIAVVYDVEAQDAADAALGGTPALHFSARSLPVRPSNPTGRSAGKPGTVYYPATRFLGDTFSSARGVQFGDIRCADWSGWKPTESLTIDNAVIVFREGPALALDLSGALTVSGTYAELDIGGGGGALLDNRSSLSAGVPRLWSAEPLSLRFGSVSLGAKSYLEIYAGPTNGTSAARTEVTIAGALDLAANAQLLLTCHPTNAAVTRVSAGSLNVAAGAVITSDSWGWQSGYYGAGPGAPTVCTSRGAAYGGAAHINDSRYGHYCRPYGSPDEPVHLGSSGALSYTQNYGSAGGGVVWLEISGDAVVNGTLTAGGQSQLGGSSGTGSGGSVYLKCRTLSGKGTLSAKGGYGQFQNAAGSGGRIAVKYNAEAQAAAGCPDIIYTTMVTAADGARALSDFGSVYFTDATLLGNRFASDYGVAAGSVYLGSGWETWRPQGIVASNAYTRLASGSTPLTIAGDVLVTGNSEFGIGGGDYAYTNSYRRYAFTKGTGPQVRITGDVIITNVASSTNVKRSEFWVLAGDRCGTDARSGVGYGGLLEIDGSLLIAASNSQFRTMCHPNDGWGVKVTA